MGLLKKAVHLVGPILAVIILVEFIDISSLMTTFGNAVLHLLLLSVFFNFLMYSGKVYRIYYLLKKNLMPFGFFYLAKMYACSNFLGQVSNMLVADITNAGILMADSRNRLAISNIFIAGRIADLFFVTSVCLVTLYLNRHMLAHHVTVNYISVTLLIVLAVACVYAALFFRERFVVFMRSFAETAGEHLVAIIAITSVVYLFCFTSAYYDIKALSLDLPLSYLFFAYTLGGLITILPLSVGGIGTRDIAFIFLLGLAELSPESAVALSFVGFILVPYLSLCMLYVLSVIGVAYENRSNR